MSAPQIRHPQEPGAAAAGHAGRLRDADWLPLPQPAVGGEPPAGAQLLHRWRGAGGSEDAPALAFLPLDGNPRHGVLGLFLAHRADCLDAIEILERQGRWLVMPEQGRALLLARGWLAGCTPFPPRRSGIAGTPDRRFVFFNTLREGDTVTLVERRQDGGVTLT